MASSLTIAQKIALYQILETPYATSFYTQDGMGTLAAQTTVSAATISSAYTQINTHLDTLTSLNGEAELIVLINRWITIGTTVAGIDGGSIGGASGLTMSYDRERAIIKERVQLIVPFFRWHEVLARKQEAGGGITIPMMR